MPVSFDSPIGQLKGVGERRALLLSRLKIETVRDLLYHVPRSYSDRRSLVPIDQLLVGDDVPVCGRIVSQIGYKRLPNRRDFIRFEVSDGTGQMTVFFFNQGYLRNRFSPGQEYIFFGRVGGNLLKRQMANPEYTSGSPANYKGTIEPIYSLTAGIGQSTLKALVKEALGECGELADPLPPALRAEFDLMPIDEALVKIHFPQDLGEVKKARERLAFDELLILQVALCMLKSGNAAQRGITVGKAAAAAELFCAALPFELTAGQKNALAEITADLSGGRAMNRLVQGDVGSGKTAVAAAAAYACAANGYQATLMAPTEILAQQHYKKLAPLFEKLGVQTALLTGSTKAGERGEILERCACGETGFVVGTHALIEQEVKFANLALCITDEQHRFGVRQRAEISAKSASPHVLVMSATPIPRTLALMMYGDLDISEIRDIPGGREPVETFVVGSEKYERLLAFASRQIAEGGQVYMVCPVVEQEGPLAELGIASAEAVYEELSKRAFSIRVGLVHGKQKPKEKETVMAAFARGEIDLLVATTVIEVGIDVPNANLMIVRNAERFGLSQLHQLRGRIGRGKRKSYCVLVSDSMTDKTKKRLQVMKNETSGFKIAEEDLKLRGPGDFFGEQQHGLPAFKVADLLADASIIPKVAAVAKRVIGSGAQEYGALMSQVRRLMSFERGNFLN